MGKFTEGISKIVRRVRRASTITIDVLFAHPDADRSTRVPETPSFYLVQTSPTECQQRYITPRSSTLISSTGTLVVRNPDRSPSPARTLRSAEELLPDGEITAESFELQISDEEANAEPDQEEFGDNVEEASPQPEPRSSTRGDPFPLFLSTECFPNTAELNRSNFGYRYDVMKPLPRLPRLDIPPVTFGNQEAFSNVARHEGSHRELESLPSNQGHSFSGHLRPSVFEHKARVVKLSASGDRTERPQLVVIPAVRSGTLLPEPLPVPVRALTREELKTIRKAEFQLIPRRPLTQRLTGGLDYKKALAELNHSFTRMSKADLQLIPRKPLAKRLTGGVAYKKALAELKQRHKDPEHPVLPPSHHVRDHSHRHSPPIPELPTEALSSQLPVLWSRGTRSRSLVVRGNTVTFDGAYHTYMHHRRQTRQRRYLERAWETWGRKFEKQTSLAQEISDALAELGTFDIRL